MKDSDHSTLNLLDSMILLVLLLFRNFNLSAKKVPFTLFPYYGKLLSVLCSFFSLLVSDRSVTMEFKDVENINKEVIVKIKDIIDLNGRPNFTEEPWSLRTIATSYQKSSYHSL